MKKYAILALTAVMATSILTVSAKASPDQYHGIVEGGCVLGSEFSNDYCIMEPRNEGFVPFYLRTCRPGDVDTFITRDVQHLQCLLTTMGYKNLDEVGVFGPKTEEAVRDFQAKYGLDVNGIVAPETWEVIRDVSLNELIN